MRRLIAAALVLSVLGSVFAVAPVAAATYTASGSCSWIDPDSGLGMVMGYPAISSATKTEAQAYVDTMRVDCKSHGGKLDATIIEESEPVTYTASGSCSWIDPDSGLGMVMGYPAISSATKTEAQAYVDTMRVDCKSHGGKMTSTLTKT